MVTETKKSQANMTLALLWTKVIQRWDGTWAGRFSRCGWGDLLNTLVGYFSTRGDYPVVFLRLALLQPLGLAGLWLWLQEPISLPQGRGHE